MYDKPVKLFSNVSAKDYDFPHEYYTPRDYYGQASQIAKKFCKKHPDADKDTAYMAASEAAEVYDLGGPNTRAKFQTVVEVKIRSALLELKKRRAAQNEPQEKKEENELITPEIKAAIIADARLGLRCKELAAKYGMNEKSVEYHLCEARKRGELPPAKGSTKKHKKPEPVIEEPHTVIANGERVTLPPDDPEEKTWALPNRAQEQEELEKARHPEAYPGQINDEIPQAVKGHESKVEGIIRDYYAEKQPCLAVPNPFRRGVWEELSLQLTLTLCALLGLGAVCTARSYDEEESLFHAFIKNADGRKYKLKLEEIK